MSLVTKAKYITLTLAMAAAGLTGCATSDDVNDDSLNDEASVAGTAFVHLFEWRWNDIADECEQFLGPRGFEAVQVSPPNEHIDHNTWWARYQPVSYRLESRSGTRGEFVSMVKRCSDAGVAIYADLVFNHTAIHGNSGVGTGGTEWSLRNHPEYGPENYHQPCEVNNYQDPGNVQFCGLSGLPDLATEQDHVREQMAAYIRDLVAIGVAGFRIDAAKHMPPQDIEAILARAGNPYVFLEVIGAEGEAIGADWFTHIGQVTEFAFGPHIADRFKHGQIRDLGNIADGKLPSDRAIVFTDNHDNQRGHGAAGEVLSYKDGSKYNIANAFMLAMPYGYPKVMSSYQFDDGEAGPPGGGGCGNAANVCEHRWTTIANMVGFRNVTSGEGIANWWDNGNNRLAFGRGDKGFIAINNEGNAMNETLQTGLPAGTYCNIAAGDFANDSCTGPTITVNKDGTARFEIGETQVAAMHIGARLPGDGGGDGDPVSVTFTCQNGDTYVGQSVYVVGSIATLGDWSPAAAIKLDPAAYPTWSGSIDLPASTIIEWKCLKREEANPDVGVEWQDGDNNILSTPSSGSTSASAGF